MNFDKLRAYIEMLPDIGFPFVDCAVALDHEIVFRHSAGFTDAARSKAVAPDDLFWLFSATKPITCTAAMQLVTAGKIGLDDKLSDYIPEFEHMLIQQNGTLTEAKNPILIRHLFDMTAGFSYDLRAPALLKIRLSKPTATTLEVIRALASVPLAFEPGTRFRYSLCHDVLAAVIEVASSMSFRQYLFRNLFDPIGMKNFDFFLTPEQEAHMTQQFVSQPRFGIFEPRDTVCEYRLTDVYESGGAGLFGNVDGYIAFADALACGGVAKNGNRIMPEEGIRMMRENTLCHAALFDYRDSPRKYGYGFGLCCRAHMSPGLSHAESPVGEFGWDGAAASYVLVDPVNHLSIFFGTHVRGCNPAYEKTHPYIRDLVYQELRAEGKI